MSTITYQDLERCLKTIPQMSNNEILFVAAVPDELFDKTKEVYKGCRYVKVVRIRDTYIKISLRAKIIWWFDNLKKVLTSWVKRIKK